MLGWHVAPNAVLNAGGRADIVKCHEGTRKEVIGFIEKWGNMQVGRTAPVFWLSGPAGAGKSAVVQTFAEQCNERGVLQANFFFFRPDSSRNKISPLIATLLDQIILLYPFLRYRVDSLVRANPFLLDSTFESQLVQLIVTPLRALQQSSVVYRPLLLLIDGLDECDSEIKRGHQQILDAFDKVLVEYPCPFRLLVASRDEPQIKTALNGMSSQCLHLHLDNQYSPDSDIRAFVCAKFEQVRMTHPFAELLPESWPSVEDINYIVEKSSGQFSFAASAMRLISDPSDIPQLSLAWVQGAATAATKSPFSRIDANYMHILSRVEDQQALKDILHAHFLIKKLQALDKLLPEGIPAPSLRLTELLELYNRNYTQGMVLACLDELTPILQHDYELRFYHTSFTEFLQDQSRSGEYFVDAVAFNSKIPPVIWKHIAKGSHDRHCTSVNPPTPLLGRLI